MTGCFAPILLLVGAVLILASLLRWFEQTADAFDRRDWNRLVLLIVFPFAVWFYPSRVAAGRPTLVPRHEPVRGFGKIPGTKASGGDSVSGGAENPPPAEAGSPSATEISSDQPPPGTPSEFIGLPKIPPKKPKAAVDPEKLAKLRQKMKDQGMLGD